MDVKNITGLEKPLVKLIETVREGVGVVGNHVFEFNVAKVKRIGKAEAEAEKQKIVASAEAQSEALEIFSRAEKRFALEQYNKQINLENIIVKTREDLTGKEVSQVPVERDWFSRFMGIAQDVSLDQMQDILARVLSGEIQKPGSFSPKTLDVIKNLSKSDLENFQKFSVFSSKDGFFHLDALSKAELMEQCGLDFNEYIKLSDVGLFNQSNSLAVTFNIETETPTIINIGHTKFAVSVDKNAKKLSLNSYIFSTAGYEIYPLVLDLSEEYYGVEAYKELFIKHLKQSGFLIKEMKTE